MEGAKSTESIDEIGSFRHLSEASRSLLAHGLRYVQFPNKAPVLKKGQRVSGAYVVVSGKLRVFTISPGGHEATLYLINPGETCVLALNCVFKIGVREQFFLIYLVSTERLCYLLRSTRDKHSLTPFF